MSAIQTDNPNVRIEACVISNEELYQNGPEPTAWAVLNDDHDVIYVSLWYDECEKTVEQVNATGRPS